MKLWKALAKIESCFLERKIDAYMETMGYVGITKLAHETNSSYFQENFASSDFKHKYQRNYFNFVKQHVIMTN